MPKDLFVDPQEIRKPHELSFPRVPIHAYATPIAAARRRYGDAGLKRILRAMLLIREFETMLGTFKAKGAYESISFDYKGPAHLSIGQEGAAVGAAIALSPEDQIFGSHRSHGEFIAKGLSAIAAMDEAALTTTMEGHDGGRLLRAVESHLGGADAISIAENFLLLGLLAEIFMRATGFNGGMGGSMHAFFPPFGAYPNNAIVGASAGIAAGAALFKKLSQGGGITVSSIGDGATGCGPVWEAMNFAAMAQYNRLWPEGDRGGLPVLFFFVNNFYAMGGQTIGETAAWDRLSRIGAGINQMGLHAETVDGSNPLAVADAVTRKRAHLVEGGGPALLDVECYRFSGHSTTDVNVYRSKEEMSAWQAHDPITLFAVSLRDEGIIGETEEADMRDSVTAQIRAVTAAAVDPEISPLVDIESKPTLIGDLMFSQEQITLPEQPNALADAAERSTPFRQLAKKSRVGRSEDGELLSPMRAVTVRDALAEALLYHVGRDESLVVYGEECREWGGAFGVYRGFSDLLPRSRLFNAPISEAAIVASAVGYAMAGGRALVELMYADFIGRAGDEIFNQMAKWQAMSGGLLKLPVVLRCSVGSKYGAQHSQDWSGLIAHIPGLKLVYPATPFDAKGLLASALSSNDPIVFFESQRLYQTVEQFRQDGVPTDYYRLPIGQPDIKRQGKDLTILTIGPSLYPAMVAADRLKEAFDLSVEVLDARSLVPFNYGPVLRSLEKTGRVLVLSEACERGSFAMTLAANITQFGFRHLKAAPRVLGAPNWIVPGAEMESTYFPQVDDIIDAVCNDLIPELAGKPQGVRRWDAIELAGRGL